MKKIVWLLILCFSSLEILRGNDSIPIKAIEKHYQYLETEVKNYREEMQRENEAYRKFIQEERQEHQGFLQRTYTIAGILITVVVGILTFFGINTFQGINKSRREIESVATNQLLEYSKALNESHNRLNTARQQLINLEKQYQEYVNYYRNADPKNGRYLFVGSSDKLDQMSKNELVRFVQVFGTTEKLDSVNISKGQFYPASYDVVIYRSGVDRDGEDPILDKVTEMLKPFPNIPLVVYAAGKEEWLKGNTEKKFNELNLIHLANNQVSLIDNVASAYRVAKLLVQPSKTF